MSYYRREKHEQEHDDFPVLSDAFVGTQFVCYLNELKFNRRGDLILSLVVPHQFKDDAIKLSDAYSVPMSVDFQRWQLYDATAAELDR